MKQFFGKYRGKVISSKDPENLGRIQVTVPAVLGEGIQSWAMPCTPYAGKDIGLFTVPPVGSNIWVEFEGGDTDYPIWSGCFWGQGELPQNAQVDEPDKVQVFRTEGITCTLSNFGNNKGITLEVKPPVVQRPLTMIFNADGIKLSNNDQTVIKIASDTIELDNRSTSTIIIAVESIQLIERSVEIKLTPSEIQLTNAPSTIKLTTSDIELSNTPSTAKLSASGVEMSNVTAKLKLAPGSSELSNSAASIKLSPLSVNVNNGALEVI
jgi:Type VI secretion system/phage-baseplate injector OB domain